MSTSKYSRAERDLIVGDDEQILALLEQCKLNATGPFRRVLTQSRSNERIASGNLVPEQSGRSLFGVSEEYLNAPQQILQNLVLAWSSQITKDRPSVYAVPCSTDLSAVSASKIYTKVIEYTEQEEGVQKKWTTTAENAAYAGTGFMYIVFNPEKARVVWRALSVHDVILDDRPEREDVQWCVIREYIDEHVAEAMLDAAAPDDAVAGATPDTETYTDGSGDEHRGVPKYTIWYRPGPRYAKGLYACIVGDTVVESTEYPYVFPDADGSKDVSLLPVAWWHCRANRGSPLGGTWANDVAPLQVHLNRLNSKLLRNAQQAQSYLVLPKSMQSNEGFDPSNGIIYTPTAGQGDQKPEWINPAPLDPNQIQEKASLIQSMYESAGISAQSTGQAGSSSGKQLAYQAELDVQKHATSFKSLEVAIQDSWILDLKLKQKYYTVPQQMALSDGGNAMVWSGADIAGIDIRLEPR